jgi:hypothetical protein
MGYYINPQDGTSKETWLEREGKRVGESEAGEAVRGNTHRPVVLVNNGGFTAAGIAYDADEFAAFTRPDDVRPKKFYVVPIDQLRPFCNLL